MSQWKEEPAEVSRNIASMVCSRGPASADNGPWPGATHGYATHTMTCGTRSHCECRAAQLKMYPIAPPDFFPDKDTRFYLTTAHFDAWSTCCPLTVSYLHGDYTQAYTADPLLNFATPPEDVRSAESSPIKGITSPPRQVQHVVRVENAPATKMHQNEVTERQDTWRANAQNRLSFCCYTQHANRPNLQRALANHSGQESLQSTSLIGVDEPLDLTLPTRVRAMNDARAQSAQWSSVADIASATNISSPCKRWAPQSSECSPIKVGPTKLHDTTPFYRSQAVKDRVKEETVGDGTKTPQRHTDGGTGLW
ncbi:hypothetical protein BIW11_02230 [Tropilaelaps mercedesae]|uniref:Uncharacterized protein n=1 Tax=Tropilaelaps mercedesae TaxID=418985 RepID=A0A1V9X1B1_9ACAR|nr:hypothetical protein BIW11_02230 [Tropilaelaps mercedesae]